MSRACGLPRGAHVSRDIQIVMQPIGTARPAHILGRSARALALPRLLLPPCFKTCWINFQKVLRLPTRPVTCCPNRRRRRNSGWQTCAAAPSSPLQAQQQFSMSWQAYVDDHLMCQLPGGGQLAHAAIWGQDGGIWAQDASFPAVTPEEIAALVAGFNDPSGLAQVRCGMLALHLDCCLSLPVQSLAVR